MKTAQPTAERPSPLLPCQVLWGLWPSDKSGLTGEALAKLATGSSKVQAGTGRWHQRRTRRLITDDRM
jgi:hypothetical protein